MSRVPRDLHPVAWWCWAIGLATYASFLTNPVLLLMLMAVAAVTVLTCRSDQTWARSFRLYLWLAVVVVLTRVLFAIVLGTSSAGHTILPLPQVPLPSWAAGITLLGPFTREELLVALDDGLRLAAILVAVGAANALANPKRLMRSLPPALYEIGTAMVVAITVIPQLADSAARIRAAQALRGGPTGRFRRIRGVRRTLVPILEDAFERSLSLAAGMDARGYGRAGQATASERRRTGALLIAGLCGVAVGVYAMLDQTAPRLLAVPMLVLGVGAALVGFVAAGRRVHRTRYRAERWTAIETAVALSGLAVGVAGWLVRHTDVAVAQPPVDAWPPVTVAAVAALLLGLLPLWIAPPPLRRLTATPAPHPQAVAA
ncbi:energy-coupling factor transporter transmembrane component T [Nocardioides ultimimeridianus]